MLCIGERSLGVTDIEFVCRLIKQRQRLAGRNAVAFFDKYFVHRAIDVEPQIGLANFDVSVQHQLGAGRGPVVPRLPEVKTAAKDGEGAKYEENLFLHRI